MYFVSLIKIVSLLIIIFIIVPCSTIDVPDQNIENNLSLPKIDFNIPFVNNVGIYSDSIQYYAKIFSGKCFVTEANKLYYTWYDSLGMYSFNESFISSNNGEFIEKQKSPTKVSYFRGNDPQKWQSDINTARSLEFENIYSNIDLELKSSNNNIEKIFTIRPGGDPSDIAVRVNKPWELSFNKYGEILVIFEDEIFKFTKPFAYQIINNKQVEIKTEYQICDNSTYCFSFDNYNPAYDLVIDPLIASSYVGGSNIELNGQICLDNQNNIYIFGQSYSDDIPFPDNAYNDSLFSGNESEPLILQISSDLTELLSATFISGSEEDGAGDICVSPSGDVYVTGRTRSNDFPTTPDAYCTTYTDFTEIIFVSCFDPDLTTLRYSTFLGGHSDDWSKAIVCDDMGNIYVTGHTRSDEFPTTPGAFDETFNSVVNDGDSFVSKFDPTLSYLLSSTYLGSSNGDYGTDIGLDNEGVVHIVGYTGGSNFPTTPEAYSNYVQGWDDVFISKMDQDLTTLIYSTLFGGSSGEDDRDPSFTIADDGSIYVVGCTRSDDLPVTQYAFDTTYETWLEGFIARFSYDLSDLIACSYAGNWGSDYFDGITLDENYNIYAIGSTVDGFNLITENAFMTEIDPEDGFQGLILKVNPDLTTILAGTYIGGTQTDIGLDIILVDNNILAFGKTNSSDFPVTPGAYKTESIGAEWFVSILDPNLSSGTYVNNNEITDEYKIFCYPNPYSISSGQMSISFSNSDFMPSKVEIYNIKGERIRSLRNNLNRNIISWDGLNKFGESMSPGVYLINIEKGNNQLVNKFLIVK